MDATYLLCTVFACYSAPDGWGWCVFWICVLISHGAGK